MDIFPLHFLPGILNSHLIFQFLMAFLLAAVIGTERDMHGRPAGLRTNILVSLGACSFAVLSVFSSFAADGTQIADPTRISAQIITGIGC